MTTLVRPTKDERRNRRRHRREHAVLSIPSIFNVSHVSTESQLWRRYYRSSLSPSARLRAETVWRYLSFMSDQRRPPREIWFRVLEKQFWPDESVFQWEDVILTCIDMPYIRDQLEPETYERLIFTEHAPTLISETQHIPLHDINTLESAEVLSSRWCDLPQETRDECGMSAQLHFFMRNHGSYAELEDTEDAGLARLSATRVIASRVEEHFNFFKKNPQMWGKHYGALCSGCEKISRDCKKCGACGQVYYCSKECQKRDWPAHKTTCKAQKVTDKENIPDVDHSTKLV